MRLSRRSPTAQPSGGIDRRTKIVSTCCAVAGGLGAVACSLSMTLAAIGIIGSTAAASGSVAGMAGMGSGTRGQPAASGPIVSFIRFLVDVGPPLLLISVIAITVSFAMRRRPAIIPALLAGAVMYAGMYLQSGALLMYSSILLRLVVWISIYLWIQGWWPKASSSRALRMPRS